MENLYKNYSTKNRTKNFNLIYKNIFENVNNLNKKKYYKSGSKNWYSSRKPKKSKTDKSIKKINSQIINKKFQILKENKYDYNISSYSIPGIKNNIVKENQDRLFVVKNLLNDKNNILLGIIDGHGEYGSLVADYVKNNFYFKLESLLKKKFEKEEIIKAIKFTFVDFNKDLINKSKINWLLSGCTLSIVLIFKKIIYCANVGDSQVFLVKEINNKNKCFKITKIHSPYNEIEKKRILEFGGEIRKIYCESNIANNPLRIWFKNENYPGLMMTRCMGDTLGRRIGLIASPYISILNLNNSVKYIILGSDGLWDHLSSNTLWKEINCSNENSVSYNLSMISKKEWSKNKFYNDDISCLTLKIKTK